MIKSKKTEWNQGFRVRSEVKDQVNDRVTLGLVWYQGLGIDSLAIG